MLPLPLRRDPQLPIEILCLGAHSDDLEIGCGATMLQLTQSYPSAAVRWVVFSADGEREREARAGANLFLEHAAEKQVAVQHFRESFFPYVGTEIKESFEDLKSSFTPDVVFTHYRNDLHQDHKLISDLTWNTFRDALILEYEIPKWDGDLGTPNLYVPVSEELADRKVEALCEIFQSQRDRHWFTADTFRALLRLRGVESNAAFAEAFYARKLVLG